MCKTSDPRLPVTDWRPPPTKIISIETNDLHVWSIDLDTPCTRQPSLLSDDELDRLSSIRSQVSQQRFHRARSALRLILSRYLDVSPESIQFRYGKLGKPTLAYHDSELHFNLSHSGNQALLGVRKIYKVGVDIEALTPRASAVRIAHRVLPKEIALELESIEEPERSALFIRHWTKMEAMSKADGGGVFSALDPLAEMTTHSWNPAPGWHATIASEGPLPNYFDWKCYSATSLFD